MNGLAPIRIGVACGLLAAAAAVAVLLPLDGSSATAVEPLREPGPLYAAQLDVLERSGLTNAEAQHELAVQTAIDEARLISKLEAELGREFAGLWLEPAKAKLYVGVTSAASRVTVEAVAREAGLSEDVVPTSVDSTWGALRAAKAGLSRQFSGLLAKGRMTLALLPDSNAVAVQMASTLSSAMRGDLRREASASPVDIALQSSPSASFGIAPEARCRAFEFKKGFCDPTIVAGASMRDPSNSACTIGPAVIKKDFGDNTTLTYVLTAGHCMTKTGEWWTSADKSEVSKDLGPAAVKLTGAFGAADVGLIKLESDDLVNQTQIPVNPAVANWEGIETDPLPVAGSAVPTLKHTSCHSGDATGTQCGLITKLGVESVQGWKELVEVQNMSKVSENGDSGGPWFSAVEGAALVEGTHVGRLLDDKGAETAFSIFEPLWYDISALESKGYEYKLLTTANQTRPKCKMPAKPCLNSEVSSPTLTGKQPEGVNDVFGGDAGSVECENTSWTGSFVTGGSADPEAKLAPTYSGCKGFGFTVTIDANGCEFVFHSDAEEAGIKCPAGKKIAVTNSGCEVTIGEQSKLKDVASFTNEGTGTGRAVTIDFEISGIAYEEHQKIFPVCKNATKATTNGTYKGRATITAETGGGSPKGLWVE